MPNITTATDILNREFLEVRAKILEVAAALDRLDRAAGSVSDDPRMDKIRRGIDLLRSPESNRAEQVQLLFSIPFEDQWRSAMQVDKRF